MIKLVKKELYIFGIFLIILGIYTGSSVNAQKNISSSRETIRDFNISDLNISKENIRTDSVIVTLNEIETKKFLTYTPDDFSEVGCSNVEDLTKYTVETVKNIVQGIAKQDNKMINVEEFRRVLKLELESQSIEGIIDAIHILSNMNGVLYVTPNYIIDKTSIPNDDYYLDNDMWGLNGTYGIDAENAWDISVGCSEINVAVIDTGIEYNHPDLQNRINPTDIHKDFTVSPAVNVKAEDLYDIDGHGTHVAGIIGAEGNNKIGITGVAWNVKLVSLKTFPDRGKADASSVAAAINYAASVDIPIINYSGGQYGYEYSWESALKGYNGLFVCSAGNLGIDNDIYEHYPSNFSYDKSFSNRIISVGSINKKGNRSTFSNYSSTGNTVNIYAPGENILSTIPYSLCPTGCNGFFHSWESTHYARGYHYNSGTSMATPFVAGAAAVLLSANNSLTSSQIKKAIIDGAEEISINIPDPLGKGTISQIVKRLNLNKALKQIAYKVNDSGEKIIGTWFNPTGSICIPTTINGTTITNIGTMAFKGCSSLSSITIPNSVINIDSNAFQDCSYLQTVTLSNSITSIKNSVFKGCSSLSSITIPNSVINIDSSGFENCSYLQNITLSNNLTTIGASAFKGCSSLSSITLPSKVEYIDDEAFKNCSSLSTVTLKRATVDIANLGQNVFSGCSNALQIVVPTNRVAEYKNKQYWSSYKSKIIPSGEYTTLEIDCESNFDKVVNLDSGYNKLYQLNVNCGKTYQINTNASSGVTIQVYNSNMDYVASGDNLVDTYLGVGTYYISIEFTDHTVTGVVETNFGLRWPSSDVQLNYNVNNNILSNVHNTTGNVSHGKFYYWNNRGAGLFLFKLNGGTNENYPKGAITIYDNQDRTIVLDRYANNDLNKSAVSNDGEYEMYVYLPKNGFYYIDIILPSNIYSILTFRIEEVEENDINYLDSLDSIGFSELFFNKTSQSYFEEVTISHRSIIEYDIQTSRAINENIPVYILEKHRDSGDNHYYIVPKLIEAITKTNKSPVFSVILDPGTYYIGYADNFEQVGIHAGLRRKVNYDLNISGTLVTDPAYHQQFELGTEVTLNHGELLGNTITEGFTRNIYLMVEDRFRDPMSRLEYDWYSSNENVAKVTKYATVLALNVTKDTVVTIYAINKVDPSIVYRIDFTILNDTSTDEVDVECNMTYSYAKENGTYQLELDFTNSPYPYIQYYNWSIYLEDNINVSMDYWGRITSSGVGEVSILGIYSLNPRVRLFIHLTITE